MTVPAPPHPSPLPTPPLRHVPTPLSAPPHPPARSHPPLRPPIREEYP
ncbi:hypothetical protein ACVWXU_003101 [Streptomyces sp. TE33382]